MSEPCRNDLPKTVPITPKVLVLFRGAGIATTPDIDEFDRNEGWLSKLEAYTFKSEVIIEGPCALYGGVYGPNIWTAEGGLCSMGAASYAHSPLPEGMQVGRYCSIGKGLRFLDFSHPTEWLSSSVAMFKPSGVPRLTTIHTLCDRLITEAGSDMVRPQFDPKLGKTYPKLGHDVWIGENVTLAMGITIGTGAIVASGAILTSDVPPYAVVAGVPAIIRKFRFDEALITELLEIEWWNYCFTDFSGLDISRPEAFVAQIKSRIAQGSINVWKPKQLRLPYDIA